MRLPLRANRSGIVVTERGQLDHDGPAEQPGERDDQDALLREAVQVDDVDVAGQFEERRTPGVAWQSVWRDDSPDQR